MDCIPLMFLLFLFSSENGINQEDIEEMLAEGVTIQRYINYYQVWWLKNNLSLCMRKPTIWVSDQVRHKSGCTSTEDG